MLKLLRPLFVVPLLFGAWAIRPPEAIAQERQGCFMITQAGQLVDLGEICPTPQQLVSAEPTLGTGDSTLR